MVTRTQIETTQVTQDDSLGRLLDGMGKEDLRLERKGKRYRIIKESVVDEGLDAPPNEDIWANYDPEKARQGIQQARGAFDPENTKAAWLGAVGILDGVDVEKLIADIYDQRGQESEGRKDLEYKYKPFDE